MFQQNGTYCRREGHCIFNPILDPLSFKRCQYLACFEEHYVSTSTYKSM